MCKAVSIKFWKTEAKRNLDIGIHMEDGEKDMQTFKKYTI